MLVLRKGRRILLVSFSVFKDPGRGTVRELPTLLNSLLSHPLHQPYHTCYNASPLAIILELDDNMRYLDDYSIIWKLPP